MSDFLLRVRRHILFLPLLAPVLMMAVMQGIYTVWSQKLQWDIAQGNGDTDMLLAFDWEVIQVWFTVYLLVYAVGYTVQLSWWWSVATKLRSYLPEGTGLKPTRFRIAFTIAAIYLVGLLTAQFVGFGYAREFFEIFTVTANGGEVPEFFDSPNFLRTILFYWALAMLVGLLGMAAMVYCAYYVGKTLRCIEKQEPQKGSAVLGNVVLSYFLVIGVWILQPKVNRLLREGRMTEDITEVETML